MMDGFKINDRTYIPLMQGVLQYQPVARGLHAFKKSGFWKLKIRDSPIDLFVFSIHIWIKQQNSVYQNNNC
jgi:hypothetical protein